jgi:pyridoxal phosphate enzyme (YggS family)
VTGVEDLQERHAALISMLRATAEANGHDPDRLRIVAITKGWPVEVARAAVDAGLPMLGESRVQEAEPKIAAFPWPEWHFVGRLQSNKARRAVRAFDVIHSVDSGSLLDTVVRVAVEEHRSPRLLLQVNVTGEATKAGMSPDELRALASRLPEVPVVGLMTIARMGAPQDEARATFLRLRELRDELEHAAGIGLAELSMGMSADAEAAAAEGATLVRIGTALFGTRP